MGFVPTVRPESVVRAPEGEPRPGPWMVDGSILSAVAGRNLNWWQNGYSLRPLGESSAMVEACISAYAQTMAMCPGGHWQTQPDGGRKLMTTSALSRVIRHPNDYQTFSDFLLNLVRRLYAHGEAFAVALRNDRAEIDELHLMRAGRAILAEDGSIFYRVSGNEVLDLRFDFTDPIPARDVLHVRLHTPRHPLRGESPILSTVLDRALADAALNQQIAFYLNQAKPSFILGTTERLDATQTKDLSNRWEEQTTGANAGRTPVLSWGLKAEKVSQSAVDGQLAELLKMSDQQIALAFRVPLQILGVGDTPFASTEALYGSWKGSGLGFALNHVEEALGLLFRLRGMPDEYVEFDTRALMRSAFKDQIEGLARGAQAGLIAADEGREELGLPKVPGGHGAIPRVQQQMVPLDFDLSKLPKPAPAPPAADPVDDAGEKEKGLDGFTARDLLTDAIEIERRAAAA